MNEEEIKIIGSVRAALIHQKYTNYMPVAMDEAIEKLSNLMRSHFECVTQHTNKPVEPTAELCGCEHGDPECDECKDRIACSY
jgi:hypothetical protein